MASVAKKKADAEKAEVGQNLSAVHQRISPPLCTHFGTGDEVVTSCTLYCSRPGKREDQFFVAFVVFFFWLLWLLRRTATSRPTPALSGSESRKNNRNMQKKEENSKRQKTPGKAQKRQENSWKREDMTAKCTKKTRNIARSKRKEKDTHTHTHIQN